MTVTATSASGTAAAQVADNGAKQLSSNFDTFLKLLTTQLQHQDPTSPMDSNQFTQQLVQFSSVEQQINTNDNLKALIAATAAQNNTNALNYIGKSVVMTDGRSTLAGGNALWTYGLDGASVATTLSVTDANGKTVFTADGDKTAGVHTFNWGGKDAEGNQLADGAYTLSVTATAPDGSAVETSIASRGVVSAIDMSQDAPQLVVGALSVPLNGATLIAAPPAAAAN